MKVFVVVSHNRPYAFAKLEAAQAFALDVFNVSPDENPKWHQVGDHYVLSVRWRLHLGEVTECEIKD